MTAIKRCCALALAVLMILTALPVTAFAQAAEQEVNASLQETTVSGIANDIARQVLRSGQKNGEKIQMENTAKLDDSDEVEIIVVVNDSVADPDSRAQVNALLRTQKSALAQINRAIDGQVEPQRQYTTLLNGFSATVTYGQYKAIRKLDCVQSAFISPTFELLPDTANSNRMIGGGIYNTTGFTGEGMLVAILDTGVDMSHEIFKTAPKSPSLTREKLQSMLETYDFQVESIVKGISVSDLYYSAKIPFQFDYGDKDKDGNPGEKGSHGTHVASTAAGNVGVNDAVMGVAPQAQIINMNVFKSTGGASYADILAALEDCILLGVDVANLSLGSDCGYIDYDSEDAFTKSLLDVFERTGESPGLQPRLRPGQRALHLWRVPVRGRRVQRHGQGPLCHRGRQGPGLSGQRHHQRGRERQALPQPVRPGLHRVCGGSQLRRGGGLCRPGPDRQDRPGAAGRRYVL